MQSPLNARKKGPSQKPSDDGLGKPTIGREKIPQQGPSGSGRPTVPSGLDRSGKRASGQGAGIQSGRPKAMSYKPADNSGGGPDSSPGYGNAMRRGGSSEDYSSGRGRNS